MGGKYDDTLVYLEEMEKRKFLLHSSTVSILLNSLKECQSDPSLLKIIQKFVASMKE